MVEKNETGKYYYFGEIPQKDMEYFINMAKEKGLEYAINNFLVGKYPNVLDYFFDENRGDFLEFIPLKLGKNSLMLDLGCGCGSVSLKAAAKYKTVVAVDPTVERIELLKLKIKERKINNIIPICSSLESLDLKIWENNFDAIILNGVLEYLGMNSSDNPRNLQVNALKKCFGMLKKSGYLIVGIENRFGLRYFYGERDHGDPRFITLLPRFLANLYSKLFYGKEYRTYTYSYKEYKKILSEANFEEINFYHALPLYRYPKYVFNVSNREGFYHYGKKLLVFQQLSYVTYLYT